jgi:tyrosyl-tRNA synthetase
MTMMSLGASRYYPVYIADIFLIVPCLSLCGDWSCRFLRLFTDLPLPQIAAYEQDLLSPHPTTNINSLKSVLADEATTLLHGSECLPSIHSTASALFSSRGTLDLSALSTIRLSVPTERQGVSVIDALVSAQLASSRSDARRKISAGSVRVNDDLVTDASMEICFHKSSCPIKVSFGKKTHVLIVLER